MYFLEYFTDDINTIRQDTKPNAWEQFHNCKRLSNYTAMNEVRNVSYDLPYAGHSKRPRLLVQMMMGRFMFMSMYKTKRRIKTNENWKGDTLVVKRH